jgi:GTPase
MKIAIVGRPNVGKSALFNKICNNRISIVDEEEGVTRDRIYAKVSYFGKDFVLIDTGGIDQNSKRVFNKEVIQQANIAIDEADVLIMVVDGQIGVNVLDEQIANVLLKSKKPIVLAVNKIDDPIFENDKHNFYGLGIKEIIAVSTTQSYNIDILLESALKSFKVNKDAKPLAKSVKIAITGRANVGKSTILNYMLNENRCAVSPIAGTTRDSIDVEIYRDNEIYTFIDTAGIRRRKKEVTVIEKFAFIRTKEAIKKANICLLVIDAKKGITSEEKKIAKEIYKEGKGIIFLVNKWDLVKNFRMEHCIKSIHIHLPYFAHFPILFTEAINGRNIDDKLFDLIKLIDEKQNQELSTAHLNKFLEKTIQTYPPPMITGKRLRIYYMTQIGKSPQRYLMFANKPKLLTDTYKRYLLNCFRKTFKLTGIPIFFAIKGKVLAKAD